MHPSPSSAGSPCCVCLWTVRLHSPEAAAGSRARRCHLLAIHTGPLWHGVPPSLQELQGLNRHAEGALRRVEAAGGDPVAYAPAVEAALGAYESASQQARRAVAAGAISTPTLLQHSGKYTA
jgi:hypothetical protein